MPPQPPGQVLARALHGGLSFEIPLTIVARRADFRTSPLQSGRERIVEGPASRGGFENLSAQEELAAEIAAEVAAEIEPEILAAIAQASESDPAKLPR